LTLESPTGQTRGEDLYGGMFVVVEILKLYWSKPVNVTKDGRYANHKDLLFQNRVRRKFEQSFSTRVGAQRKWVKF